MRPLIRSILARPATFAVSAVAKAHLRQLSKVHKVTEKATAAVCLRCQFHSQPQLLWTRPRFYSSDADRNSASSPTAKDLPASSPRTDPKPPPPPSPDDLKNLPSQKENRRSNSSKRISQGLDNFQTTLFTAGQKLNVLTGYSDIESLKKSIEAQEQHVRESRLAVHQAKEDYQNAISRRSASQREVNELLQRKHAWSSTDLERFTQLYRSDHTNEHEEVAAQERLAQAESGADEAQAQLARSILARYHEEQIWSDKIRRASTWGTWGLMGFNVLLFVVVQLGLEPWKRRRLVRGFEEKVREVIQEGERNIVFDVQAAAAVPGLIQSIPEIQTSGAPIGSPKAVVSKDLVDLVAIEESTNGTVAAEPRPEITMIEEGESAAEQTLASTLEGRARDPIGYVKERAAELLSEKEVVISQKDLTVIAVQSATVGAVLTWMVSFIISHR